MLALLMALQAGLPPLDFSPLAGRGKRCYILSIHAAMNHDYAPLTANFERVIERVIERSQPRAASKGR
jgi:cell filamentation protein